LVLCVIENRHSRLASVTFNYHISNNSFPTDIPRLAQELRLIQRKSNFAQVGTQHSYGKLYVDYIKGKPPDIKIPAQWNLIGRCMTAPRPVLSSNSILPPLLSPFAFIAAQLKFGAHFKDATTSGFSFIFKNYVSLNLRNFKLRRPGSVCNVKRVVLFRMGVRTSAE
jgi:hypothetical protein